VGKVQEEKHPLDVICRDIYTETREFGPIAALRPELGFEILVGPPYGNAPIAFLGYQPGDWPNMSVAEARERGYEDSWVTDQCQYATEDWPLARGLRDIFPRQLLAKCVGLNAIFVRARNAHEYQRAVSLTDRKLIRAFCLGRVRRILDAIKPRQIVVIGLGTLELFGRGTPSLISSSGSVLAKTGLVFGKAAHAVVHLTGARIKREHRLSIKQYLQSVTLNMM
jgi:hypothetical protein